MSVFENTVCNGNLRIHFLEILTKVLVETANSSIAYSDDLY